MANKKIFKKSPSDYKKESLNFEQLAIFLYSCWNFLSLERMLLNQQADLITSEFPPKNNERLKNQMEASFLNDAKKIYSKKQNSYFPHNLILTMALDMYFDPEGSRSEINNQKDFPKNLLNLLSLKNYCLSKLYENFDPICSVVGIEPDKFYYDLWWMGDSIKTDSYLVIGYWINARDAKHTPIRSAYFKTKKREKRIEGAENLLFQKYGNVLSEAFREELKKITTSKRTYYRYLKKIKEHRKKERSAKPTV